MRNIPDVTPELEKARSWIAALPSTREAVKLLKLVKAPQAPGVPAVLALLQWAVEDAAPHYHLDTTQAQPVLDELLYLTMQGKPRVAVKILLNLDDPCTEVPPELLATTPKDATEQIISLANQARAM